MHLTDALHMQGIIAKPPHTIASKFHVDELCTIIMWSAGIQIEVWTASTYSIKICRVQTWCSRICKHRNHRIVQPGCVCRSWGLPIHWLASRSVRKLPHSAAWSTQANQPWRPGSSASLDVTRRELHLQPKALGRPINSTGMDLRRNFDSDSRPLWAYPEPLLGNSLGIVGERQSSPASRPNGSKVRICIAWDVGHGCEKRMAAVGRKHVSSSSTCIIENKYCNVYCAQWLKNTPNPNALS